MLWSIAAIQSFGFVPISPAMPHIRLCLSLSPDRGQDGALMGGILSVSRVYAQPQDHFDGGWAIFVSSAIKLIDTF
jgi:hypothetical protein